MGGGAFLQTMDAVMKRKFQMEDGLLPLHAFSASLRLFLPSSLFSSLLLSF